MHLRHLFSPRLRGSLLLGSLLVASSFSTLAAEDMLRKAVGKGAYEMAWSQQEKAGANKQNSLSVTAGKGSNLWARSFLACTNPAALTCLLNVLVNLT